MSLHADKHLSTVNSVRTSKLRSLACPSDVQRASCANANAVGARNACGVWRALNRRTCDVHSHKQTTQPACLQQAQTRICVSHVRICKTLLRRVVVTETDRAILGEAASLHADRRPRAVYRCAQVPVRTPDRVNELMMPLIGATYVAVVALPSTRNQ
jgi:hypothetical protein